VPDLADAVLLAAAAWPGEVIAEDLAVEVGREAQEVQACVAELRARGLLQKQRGNPAWGSTDRLRASKAGREACRRTLRGIILGP